MSSGKVQTNEYKVNVLVETTNSNNRHYSSHNRPIEVVKVLSDEEILEAWKNRTDENELELAKNWIKRQDGFAFSACRDKVLNIDYQSVVEFK